MSVFPTITCIILPPAGGCKALLQKLPFKNKSMACIFNFMLLFSKAKAHDPASLRINTSYSASLAEREVACVHLGTSMGMRAYITQNLTLMKRSKTKTFFLGVSG